MMITAQVNVFNNEVLVNVHWSGKLVGQCFRVKFTSKKRACIIFSLLLSMLLKSAVEKM